MRNPPQLRFQRDVPGLGTDERVAQIQREIETKLNPFLRQLGAGIKRLDRGVKTDQSGTSVVDAQLDDYFFLPGRFGGQVGHGARESGGFLKLRSTKHDTKGLIYLGSQDASAYDDANDRLGLKTVAPEAVLHVTGEAPVSQFWRPATSISGVGFAASGGSFPAVCAEAAQDGDATYIVTFTANPSQITGLFLDGDSGSTTPFPANTTGWIFRYYARKFDSDPVSYDWKIRTQSGADVVTGSVTNGSPGATLDYNDVIEVALTPAQAASLAAGGVPSFQFVVNNFLGLGASSVTNQVRITMFELEVPGEGDGGGGKTAIFRANSTQTETLSEWQDDDDTPYITITRDGRLTIETTGSMRFVPGAGANKVPVSDADGDLTLTTLTLFGSIFDTTGTPASGDLIYRNASSQWALRNIGTTGQVLTVSGGLPTWSFHNLLSASHGDTVASAAVLGGLIYANSTPAWQQLAGNTTTTRMFLRQVGNGTISAAPAWDTLVAGDIPALSVAAGWTDDGATVRLTTSTDQVGIGTVSPSARLGIVNTNAASTVVLQLTGATSQSGAMISALNVSARNLFNLTGATINLGNATDAATPAVITFGQDNASFTGPTHTKLNFGENNNNLSDPNTTADQVGVAGARLYAYKDSTGGFDSAYGQSFTEAWVLVGPSSIPYVFYSGNHPSAPYKRWEVDGVGDQINYGRITLRKNLGPSPSTPELRLEETGAGTNYMAFRAASAIADHTYVFPSAVANGIFNNSVSGSTGTLSMLTAVRGELIYGNSTPAWAKLAVPGSASVLGHNATDVAWITRPTNRIIWLPVGAWEDAGMGTALVTNGTVGGLQVATGWFFDSGTTYVIDTTIATPTDVSGSVQWFVIWSTDTNEAANWVPFLNYGSLSGAIPAGTSISSTVSASVSVNNFITSAIGSPVAHGPSVALTLRFARIPGSGSDVHVGNITVYAIYGVYTPVY